MGFTIATYQLFGLPALPDIYVSIKGSFTIQKNNPLPQCYTINYTVYYAASSIAPCITQQDQRFHLEELPQPADLYTTIYNNIKKILDPQYKTDEQTLVFTDDVNSEL